MIRVGSSAPITGASGGIGDQFARQLANRNVKLVLVARSEQRLNALADQVQGTHPGLSATVVAADLSTSDAPAAVTDKLQQARITVDLLINNAGVSSLRRLVDEDRDAVQGGVITLPPRSWRPIVRPRDHQPDVRSGCRFLPRRITARIAERNGRPT